MKVACLGLSRPAAVYCCSEFLLKGYSKHTIPSAVGQRHNVLVSFLGISTWILCTEE